MRVDLLYALTNRSGNMSWNEVLQAARKHAVMADKLGFEGIWLGEHHFDADGVDASPNPILLAADLAARTERIRFGMAAVQLPLWHPVRAAEDLAVLDHLCGGRLDAGFARGIVDFEVMNLNPKADRWSKGPEASEAIYDENFEIVKAAMTSSSLRYKSENYTIPWPNMKYKAGFGGIKNPNNVDHGINTVDENGILAGLAIVPQPVQKPMPPMYNMTESERGFIWSAQHDVRPVTWYPTHKGLNYLYKVYQQELARAHGKHVELGEHCPILRMAFIAKTDEEARRITEESVDGFARFVNYIRRGNPWLDIDEDPNDPKFADVNMFDLLMERDHLMIGSPESVIERIKRLSKDMNVKHLLLQMGFPGIRGPDVESSMELFGKEVLPVVRDL